MPLIILLAIVLVCTLSVIYVAGIELVSLATALVREVRKHAGVFIVLLFGSGMAAADVTTMPDSDVFTSLLELLISQLINGSFTWVDWLLVGVVVAHFLATAYINFTDTPDDNTAYGKLYRYLLEPLAGVIFKHKVKQKNFSDIRLK